MVKYSNQVFKRYTGRKEVKDSDECKEVGGIKQKQMVFWGENPNVEKKMHSQKKNIQVVCCIEVLRESLYL